ncbi:TPA: lysin, partial [Streptococcus agalactiae]|nr:lysin [Streptococcus agalactiae]HEO1893297.1 lysin [Streptococcus agalactiae]HEO7918393.1 lysin [Streptococcus agalactiae]
MATYQEYKNRSNGNAYDIDGSFGAQCWDGYADYCRFLGVPYANCTNTGYARDIWEQRHENGILNYFDEVETMQAGDVAIFMVVDGVTPYSHVA